jgi:hypothetical protein
MQHGSSPIPGLWSVRALQSVTPPTAVDSGYSAFWTPQAVTPHIILDIEQPLRDRSAKKVRCMFSAIGRICPGRARSSSSRSRYNGAGAERVMGSCSEEEGVAFVKAIPLVERAIVNSGIILIKHRLEVSEEEQTPVSKRPSTTDARAGSAQTWT